MGYEELLTQQFPEASGKLVKTVAWQLDIFESNFGEFAESIKKFESDGFFDPIDEALNDHLKAIKAPEGYQFMITSDRVLYLVKQ